VLTNDGMSGSSSSNKRISSPMGDRSRGQSKSNGSNDRLERYSSSRTNGTMTSSSSSFDNIHVTVDNANSDIDGLRINSSENGSSKVNFR
jgi:hypothetical protein